MATISATQFAQRTRQSANWADAKTRVLAAYRDWIRAAPQIQVMYSIPKPVATIRTRVRQEFERHRFANQLPVVDKLITKSAMDYQETMNYWRQMNHMMSYFQDEDSRGTKRFPSSFMEGFLEGRN